MNLLLLLAGGLLLLVLPFAISWLMLPRTAQCPLCRQETLPVQPPHARLLRRWLVVRWCMRCGWEGYARTARALPTAPEPDASARQWTRNRTRERGE